MSTKLKIAAAQMWNIMIGFQGAAALEYWQALAIQADRITDEGGKQLLQRWTGILAVLVD